MKKTIVFFILLISITMLFANGLSLNSIGPRSLGLGGAFVGLANDNTAIYWNPAGLTTQSNAVQLFGSDIVPLATYKYDAAQVDAKSVTNHYASPNLFVNYNKDKFSLGFGAYVPAGLGVEWDGKDLVAFDGPPQIPVNDSTTVPNNFAGKVFEWESKLGVFNFGPAFAYKINEKFSVGIAGNIYYGTMLMKKPDDMLINANLTPGTDTMMDTQTEMDIKGIGYGATIGL